MDKSNIICVTNQKGGVGKTTTAHSIISALTLRNHKVLAIDMDPQCNLSVALGYDDAHSGLLELMGGKPFTNCVQATKSGCHLICSNILLSAADIEFCRSDRQNILISALRPITGYDFVVIDTPPHMGVLILNAYTASGTLIVPIVADKYSLIGLQQLHSTYMEVKHQYNPTLEIGGLLLNKFSSRNIVSRQIKSNINAFASSIGTRLYHTTIRNSIATVEAQLLGQSVIEYSPKSTTAVDYLAFVDELLEV